jgi:hypothetical protein
MFRPRLLVLLALLLVPATVGAAFVIGDAGPRRQVALPPAGAAPAAVVRAYVDALDAHDTGTALALWVPAERAGLRETWLSDVDTVTGVRLGRPAHERPAWSGHRADQAVVRVPVRFDLRWRWLHGDGSMPSGRTDWGYLLVRVSPGGPWRIFDQGTG